MDLLQLTLRQGSVYYMQDRRLTSAEPHFFIVVNRLPLRDRVVLLAVSTSQVENLKRMRRSTPPECVVELAPADYPEFTTPSAVDCNFLFEMTLAELRERQMTKQARGLRDLPKPALQALIRGVLASPLVKQAHKDLVLVRR